MSETGRSSSYERREDDRRCGKKCRDDRKSDKRSSSRSDRETREFSMHARNSHRQSQNSPSESRPRDEDSNEHSSFTKRKHELNKIFMANPNLVHDVVDFWKFVEKYESIKKRSNDSDESAVDSVDLNSIGLPEKYHKSHCLNFKLGLSYGELFARVPEIEPLTESRLLRFRDVILLYLDFKQKEKFSKLKRLRDTQANLPVARYKEEIIETVKMEKVIVVAGDTGCGKSTQIPRYLHEAGFRKIGKMVLPLILNIIYINRSKYFYISLNNFHII